MEKQKRLTAMLAVVVAVVKSRPPGVSSRHHVEALASSLQRQERRRRSQADMLNIITTTSAGSFSDTPELLPLAFLSNQPKDPERGAASLPHVHFLQSLCTLQRVGSGPDSLWLGPGESAGTLLPDTLCVLMDSVVSAFRDRRTAKEGELALKACRAWTQALDWFFCQNAPCGDLITHMHSSLKELTAILMHTNQRHTNVELLTACLVTLANSRMSKSFLVGHFLCEVNILADRLWKAMQDDSPLDVFPVDHYQNLSHILWILEEHLQTSEVAVPEEDWSEWVDRLLHLEQRMFALSEEFPLFAIIVWRIVALLK
ncbi:meiosis-specific protein MEI4-like isoform X1 [Nerophis ophidion]|uniref:meiosis-specific protein MEI4-like isoform X1 n=1 Tax=Nerophis ophidion TaxID=159077 RepID=UPI002AE0AB22|nr:meiosis-specific protein MEI4-like isoform X1 [Nerophis ophidion]